MIWAARSKLGGVVFIGAVLAFVLALPPGSAVAIGDPTPPPRYYGLTILPAEPEDAPDGVPNEVLGTADRISEEHPDDFAPAYVDPGTNRVTLGVVTSTGSSILADLRAGRSPTGLSAASTSVEAGKALPASAGVADVLTTQVTAPNAAISRTRLESVQDAVFDLGDNAAYAADNIWASEVDPVSGRVVLTVQSLSATLAAAIVGAYGKTLVAVRIDPNQPDDDAQVGRQNDNSPFYGGAMIYVPAGQCTDAFSWQSGSAQMMLTAGHCVPTGGNTATIPSLMGSVASGSRENFNNGTGTVRLPNQTKYRGDIALITDNSGKASAPYIYRGDKDSASSTAVGGMLSRRAQKGDKYCTGGSFSGEICGWTVNKVGQNVKYKGGEKVRHVVTSKNRTGWCTRGGDSGGPVFTVQNGKVRAMGIHSGGGGGGSDHYGGALDKCHEVFTDIYDPYYAFPGLIKTG